MKGYLYNFVKKETIHILRDKRTMLIVFLLPIVLTLLFGFAITTEINEVNIAVVAPVRTDGVKDAVTTLSNSESFIFCGYIDPSETDQHLRSGKVQAVIVFAPDFDKRMIQASQGIPIKPAIQVILDASDTNSANAIAAYVQGIFMQGQSAEDIFQTRYLFNPQMKSAFNFVPGILGMIFMLICAMMTSVSIVREKEMGTMEVLLVSPVNPIQIIIAKMIPYLVLSFFILTVILLLSHFVLDVPVTHRLWELIVVSTVYILLSLSLGLLISTIATQQATALLFSAMVLLLPVVLLSGMIFPVENMPIILQYISSIIPARWYIVAVRKLMIEGQPFIFIIKEFLIILGMVVFLIMASLKKFNDKLD